MWYVLIGYMALALSQSCQDPNCLSCENLMGSEDCLKCSSGLFALGGNCLECSSQPLECSVLSSGGWTCWCSSFNSFSELSELPSSSAHCDEDQPCLICSSGHYLTSENICQPCEEPCSSCVSNNFCIQCRPGLQNRGGFCCDENCLACNSEECLACTEDLLLVDGKCQEQEKICIDSCLECVDFMFCTRCRNGFYLSGDLCLQCTDDVEECQTRRLENGGGNCKNADGYGGCLNCLSGFYLAGSSCLACNGRCKICDWFEVCRYCNDGFKLIDGYCCDKGCSSCKFEKCWACEEGYIFNNYKCETCPLDCDKCVNGQCIKIQCSEGCANCGTSGCMKCGPGYYLKDNVCHTCSPVCRTCESLNYCSTCYSPLVLNTYSCCVEGCDYCVTGTCWRCQDGWLYDNFYCRRCPSDCKKCEKGFCTEWICQNNCLTCDGPNRCTRCKPGYYINGGDCAQCNNACDLCDYYEVCTTCKSGYELNQGYCCDPRCSSCRFEKCWACKSGFLFSENKCQACPSNCGGCPNGICSSPAPCSNNCRTCENGICLNCQSGYYLSENNCIQCVSPCSACDTASYCTACFSPAVLLNNGCCSAGCTNCLNSICWNCAQGYTLVNGNCVQNTVCSDHCTSCSSGTCSACESGYFLTANSCQKCNSRCKTCSSAEVCTECNQGFNLIQGYCCLAGCSSCNFNTCWQCADNYIFDGNSCNLCPTTCSSCQGGNCITAPVGSTCGSNCDTCSSPTWCLTCSAGYYPKSGVCTLCNPRCSTCDWYEVCTACTGSYHLVSGYCCPTGCASCTFNMCWQCNPGYTYRNGDCV